MQTYGTPQHAIGADPDGPVDQLDLFPSAPTAPPRTRAGVPDPAWPLVGAAGAGQGGATRRALWARRAVALAAVSGLVTTLIPDRASALFGIPGLPQVVIDPTAIAKLVAQYNTLRSQLTTANSQLTRFVDNTRKLTTPYAWRDITSTLNTVNSVVSSGRALSYSTAGLAGQLGTTFPGYSYNPLTAARDMRAQKERTLSTVMQQLVANQNTGTQLTTSVARLATMKTQVQRMTTAQQAAEVNATVGVLAAEETALLRQQLLAQGSAQAVIAAEALNQRLQAAAAVAAFEAPAAALAAAPPTRPRMNASTWAY